MMEIIEALGIEGPMPENSMELMMEVLMIKRADELEREAMANAFQDAAQKMSERSMGAAKEAKDKGCQKDFN